MYEFSVHFVASERFYIPSLTILNIILFLKIIV